MMNTSSFSLWNDVTYESIICFNNKNLPFNFFLKNYIIWLQLKLIYKTFFQCLASSIVQQC